jgi:hypothetical protein
VEVNKETGQVKILMTSGMMWKPLNPPSIEGQVEGSSFRELAIL